MWAVYVVMLSGKGTISIKFDRALHQISLWLFKRKSKGNHIDFFFFEREGGEAVFVIKHKRVQYPTDCFVAASLPPITNTNFPIWNGFPAPSRKACSQQTQDWRLQDACCKWKNVKSVVPLLLKEIKQVSGTRVALSNLTSLLYLILDS